MTKKTVIQVEHLSKTYRIGREEKRSDTMFDAVVQTLSAPVRNFKNLRNLIDNTRDEETLFWALKDVSFEVAEGEVLGIIGHNGAGKSTLLKIISRITEPAQGRITIHGRVSSLLEVGTGFHPDLTGRENIYMNGTILGMRKKEIDQKLEEIIEFSGISRHIDTPVKRYSSGMTVRLAFSVAAHLEPEILIIDEVLAVGDMEFQKKCLGKMESVSKNGRTVLFVSHSMASVRSLCSRSIYLKQGQVVFDGSIEQSISLYSSNDEIQSMNLELNKDRKGSGLVKFSSLIFKNENEEEVKVFYVGGTLVMQMMLLCTEDVSEVNVGISIHDQTNQMLSVNYSEYSSALFNLKKGFNSVVLRWTDCNLSPGRYLIRGRIEVHKIESDWPDFVLGYFDVEPGNYYGDNSIGFVNGRSIFNFKGEWKSEIV